MEKTVDEFQEEIERYQAKIDDLKKQKEKLESLSYEEQFATELHAICCTSNHTDQCGWYYESWDGESKPTRNRWLKKAKALLDCGYTFMEVKEILSIVRK